MITAGLYDLFVLFLVCLFAWRGYQKGFVGQLGGLLVLIVVAAISVRYTPSLADFLGNGNASNAIAFIITILIVTLIVWNIVNALSKLVTKLKLKSWNNQMGAFLGLINGIFISMLMTFLLLVFVIPHPTTNEDGTYNQVTYDSDKSFIKNSFFGSYLTNATLTAIDHLPQGGNSQFYTNLRNLLQSKAENIKENHPDLQQQQQTYDPNSYDNYDNTLTTTVSTRRKISTVSLDTIRVSPDTISRTIRISDTRIRDTRTRVIPISDIQIRDTRTRVIPVRAIRTRITMAVPIPANSRSVSRLLTNAIMAAVRLTAFYKTA